MLRRRPEVPFSLGWYYERYWEIDREGWAGRPTFRGMCDVLDEYGITDRYERESVRRVWWAMANTEHKVRERQREREEQEAKARQQNPSVPASPRAR